MLDAVEVYGLSMTGDIACGHLSTAHWSLIRARLMAAWQHGQMTLQWEGSRCCQKRAWPVFPPCPRIKLMPCSPPQAHQLLLVHAAIEKLTSSKQNKWQNATKGGREWTGPNGAVFLRRISLLVPYTTKGGQRQKRGTLIRVLAR